MITFNPPISVQWLADVRPGSIVRWGEQGEQGEQLGFCVLSSSGPNGQKSLVTYDSSAARFVWQCADPQTVVSYDGDIVVTPNVQTFSPAFTISTDSSLYWLEGVPSVSVQVGNNVRFLDLNAGELKSRQSWPMVGGFRAWNAGIWGADGKFIPLMEIGVRRVAAIGDSSVEPELT